MRQDHTSWLIHFVRDRDPSQDFLSDFFIDDEESEMPLAIGELSPDAAAFEVLLTILRVGGLRPGYSLRNGKTTLYGGAPVLCATEMPIYSFAKYAQQRGSPTKVSPYGVAFLKSQFYEAGGRPAVYGLTTERINFQQDTHFSRIIDPDIFPIAEQYRLVSFSLAPDKIIDWTHEREWRWVPRDNDQHKFYMQSGLDYQNLFPGLPLFQGAENGSPFSKIGIIVRTAEEAAQIQQGKRDARHSMLASNLVLAII